MKARTRLLSFALWLPCGSLLGALAGAGASAVWISHQSGSHIGPSPRTASMFFYLPASAIAGALAGLLLSFLLLLTVKVAFRR